MQSLFYLLIIVIMLQASLAYLLAFTNYNIRVVQLYYQQFINFGRAIDFIFRNEDSF